MDIQNKKPNILFALADDASQFGLEGNRYIHTPNIERIARRGVIFQNAYTCNPKCAPSRACILTGRYTWELEDACNHFCYFPNKFQLLPDLLDGQGYETGYTGKGWAPGDWKKSGLKRNPAGNEYNNCRLDPPENTAICEIDYAGNFEEFLSKRKKGKPFFFWYGGNEPHRPYIFGEGIRAGKSISEVDDVPPYWPDCDEVRIDMLDYAYELEWFDMHLGRMIQLLEKIGELDNTLILVTADNGRAFPRVKGQMYEHDFHLPMVAQWSASGSKAGRKIKDIINFVDIAPTFLEAARAPICEEMTGRSFLDVFRTDMDGQLNDRRNVAYFGREKHDPGREKDLGYPVRCIRDQRYLYVRNFAPERWPAGNPETYFANCDYSPTKRKIMEMEEQGNSYYYDLAFGKRPAEELYDVIEDDACMCNLAEYPEYKEIKDKLWQQLQDFLTETKDPRYLGNPDYFDRMPTILDGCSFSWQALEEGRYEIAPFCTYKWVKKAL